MESIGIATANIKADGTSILKAIIIEPKTMKGLLKSNLKARLRPV